MPDMVFLQNEKLSVVTLHNTEEEQKPILYFEIDTIHKCMSWCIL